MSDKAAKPAKPYRIIAKVVHQKGYCWAGHKVGDEFDMGAGPGTGLVPEGMCNWAHCAIFPFTTALWFGGSFPWVKDPDAHGERVACPDGTNADGSAKVIFELRREQDRGQAAEDSSPGDENMK